MSTVLRTIEFLSLSLWREAEAFAVLASRGQDEKVLIK